VTPSAFLAAQKIRVDAFLEDYLQPETIKPSIIHKAIRYSVFSGGKRFRAGLCIAASDLFGGDPDRVLPVAAGIELIHTYSLIHDDLPCMDDDDLRRGKPTSHKVFGENIAVLAGDALNALAFDLVARADDCRLIHILAEAIGTLGMIGGQVADVEWACRDDMTEEDVEFIHTRKTSRLIEASLEMGAVAAGVDDASRQIINGYGSRIGLAFQVVDDILDIESSSEVLGKTAGSDEASDKTTYPKVFGLERSKSIARGLTTEAVSMLDRIDRDTLLLKDLAFFVIDRVN
jgi:geranylgeranyl diphosphate synthase, type II